MQQSCPLAAHSSWTCADDPTTAADGEVERRARHGPPSSVPRLFVFGPTTLAASVFAPDAGASSGGDRGSGAADDIIGSPTRAAPHHRGGTGLPQAHPQRQRLATPAELAAMAKPETFNLPTPDAGATDAAPPAPPALHVLAAVYGRQLGPALRLAMRAQSEVAVLFSAASRRTVYRVSGHPCIGTHFCTCSAYKFVVCNKGEAEHCKHQLALLLLHRFGFGSVGGQTKHAFPLHRTIPPELEERIGFMREVRAAQSSSKQQQQQQQQRSFGSRSSSQIAGAAAAMSPLMAPPAAAAASPEGPAPAAMARTGSSASPYQRGPGGSSTSTAQIAASAVAAAAAPITFTDGDGVSWIEVPEAELAGIFVA